MPTVPLATLLSWVWIAQVMEIDNAVEAAGGAHLRKRFKISWSLWANGLRLIGDEGITVAELRRQAGAACNLGGLERWGWIVVDHDGPGPRPGYGTGRGLRAGTVVRPSLAGRTARRVFPEVTAMVEQRWRVRFGAERVDALREQLLGGERSLPWSPPEVHPSDGFLAQVTGGEPTPQGAPLVALVGQRLTEHTLRAEARATVSLPLSANLLRAVDGDDVALRDLPARTGLSREAIAMAVGALARRQLATVGPDRAVRLTGPGLEALRAHREHAGGEADGGALRGALEALLGQTEALAAGLLPADGCWRSRPPYVAQTRRLLADPTGSLPWHPMVLHRGGWPDGS